MSGPRRLLPVLGALVLLVLGWALAWFGVGWGGIDDGNYLHVAQRLVDGEVLHRDVQDVHSGYVNLWHAVVIRVLGPTLLALRWPLLLVDLLAAGLAGGMVAQRAGPWRGALAALVVGVLTVPIFPNPTANWYAVGLVVLAASLADLGDDRPATETWLGVVLGLALGFRQLSAVFLAAGLVPWLLQRAPRSEGSPRLARASGLLVLLVLGAYLSRAADGAAWVLYGLPALAVAAAATLRTRWSDAAWLGVLARLAGGVALALVPLLAYHLVHGTVAAWLHDVIGVALALPALPFIAKVPHLANATAPILVFVDQGTLTATTLASSVGIALLAWSPLMAGLLVVGRIRRGERAPALGVLAVGYAPVVVHYAIPQYLHYGAPLCLAALLVLTVGRARLGPVAVVAAVWAATAGALFHAGQSTDRTMDAIYRGERLVQRPLDLPAAGVSVPVEQAEAYEALVARIQRDTSPDDAILALPNHATLYVLSERRNPTRFFNSALGLHDPVDRARAEADVAADPPAMVFWSPDDKYVTPEATAFAEALLRDYEHVGDDEVLGVEIWARRSR